MHLCPEKSKFRLTLSFVRKEGFKVLINREIILFAAESFPGFLLIGTKIV